MSSINIQFYALPEELFCFAEKWIREFNFHIVALKSLPNFKAIEISSVSDLKELFISNGEVNTICLGFQPMDLFNHSSYDFHRRNPNYLSIDIGRLNTEGLRESALSGMTDEPDVLKVWKKLAKEIRNQSSAGLWAINPVTQAKAFYKNVRFTAGAGEVAKRGTKLLPSAGWVYYTIEEPDLTEMV